MEDTTDAVRELSPNATEEELLALVYGELRRLAAWYLQRERPSHTLQPTALVNEAYLRLTGRYEAAWKDRSHFFAVASRAMRQVLVDSARRKNAEKRGSSGDPLSLDEAGALGGRPVDVLRLDEALLSLDLRDSRARQVVELRFFGGLSVEEAAEVLDVSVTTVKRDWEFARLWLFAELSGHCQGPSTGPSPTTK